MRPDSSGSQRNKANLNPIEAQSTSGRCPVVWSVQVASRFWSTFGGKVRRREVSGWFRPPFRVPRPCFPPFPYRAVALEPPSVGLALVTP